EQGQSDRAEVIRVQIAAARSAALPAAALERCAALIGANWADWTWPLVRVPRRPPWFRRGFLEVVGMPPAAFVEAAGALFRYHPIREAQIVKGGFYDLKTFVDASMTNRGGQARVPGPLFPFLANVGRPCTIRGARAEFHGSQYCGFRVSTVIGRAAVNYGR